MNPEEFDKWLWDICYAVEVSHTLTIKSAIHKAFRLGHHQGMTRAAEITKGFIYFNSHSKSEAFRLNYTLGIEAAILTDRDKDK